MKKDGKDEKKAQFLKRKELAAAFERLTDYFDRPDEDNSSWPITDYLDVYSALDKSGLGTTRENMADGLLGVVKKAFSLGYVIGQSFDLTEPEAQKDIELVKAEIKARGLLPYFPREKRAVSSGKSVKG